MSYVIDTSSLVEGWARAYPPDVFPALWTQMDALIAATQVVAPDEVLVELAKKDDDLHAWAKARPALFHPLDEELQQQVAEILSDHPRLVGALAGRNQADAFVIGLARMTGFAVVTNERLSGSSNRPKIPDVCAAYGVRCLSLLDLIRELGWTF